ncbi:COP23 domain-containing protein [Okeania sp.]|uniref:COP23 domain-containing protein n=1 Tax=Okeania sp. TaxID=3100323 RepID=UPI002B4B8E57|nr:COP23 domain-containing protein [Okeania sp.]MEB3342000.1 COP23 domain-containing protein [Okeania sp.]
MKVLLTIIIHELSIINLVKPEIKISQYLVAMKINICTKIILAFALCFGINLTLNNSAFARPKPQLICELKPQLCQENQETVCKENESCHQKALESCQQHNPNSCEKTQSVVEEIRPEIRPNKFYCEQGKNGIPTTFVKTPQGTYPVIRWVSNYFLSAGYTPMTRCRQVSNKFQLFYDDERLNYITTGIVNRQPVVCVSSKNGGPCQGVLFTLKPQQNASQTIQKLFDIRVGASTGPLYESSSRFYLNFNDYLKSLANQRME